MNLLPAGLDYTAGVFNLLPYVIRGRTYLVAAGNTELGFNGRIDNGGVHTAFADQNPITFTAAASGNVRLLAVPAGTYDLTSALWLLPIDQECNPNSLAQISRSFQSLTQPTIQEIKTLLLCQWASENLIPAGARYDSNGFYDLVPLVVRGLTYTITAGSVEILNPTQLQNDGAGTNISDGLDHAFVAGAAGVIRLFDGDFSEFGVTADLRRVF